jgi:hypothetical protein
VEAAPDEKFGKDVSRCRDGSSYRDGESAFVHVRLLAREEKKHLHTICAQLHRGKDWRLRRSACSMCNSEQSFHSNVIKTHVMKLENTEWKERDEAVAALEEQGLTVRVHNRQDNTWHIADGGLYSGYVVTGDELVELQRTNKLNIREIKSLG